MTIEIKKHHNHFFCADLHLGHEGVCKFLRNDGTKLRPWDSAAEMDEALIENWNSVVRPFDVVYVLGDVVINRKHLPTISRLNGRKRLIGGNHDIFDLSCYTKYFEDIKGVKVLSDMVLSHVPLHPLSVSQRWGTNVHGHTHANSMNSPFHVCVSMEQIDFTPISLEDLRIKITKHKESFQNDENSNGDSPCNSGVVPTPDDRC